LCHHVVPNLYEFLSSAEHKIYIYIFFEEEEFGYPKFHMYTFFTDEEVHAEICLDPPLIGCYLIV